jgi:hypothetical protein
MIDIVRNQARSALQLLLLLSLASVANGQIYQCKTATGKTLFQDTECKTWQQGKEVKIDINTYSLPAPKASLSDSEGKVLFRSAGAPSKPRTIKVNEIRLVFENPESILLDVTYTYQHPKIPASEIKVFVMPNHRYWSVQSIRAEKGFSIARIRVGLSTGNMEEDNKRTSSTNSLEVRFEHYPPNNSYGGIIWRKSIQFKKSWRLNTD